jgi:hypothetical protein
MSYDDYKRKLLINRACVVQDYKPVTYALLPNQRVISSFIENSLEQHRNSELKERTTQPTSVVPPFLLIKGTCAQTQYKIPYFLPAVRSIEYRVWVSPCRRARPVQNFKRQFEAL